MPEQDARYWYKRYLDEVEKNKKLERACEQLSLNLVDARKPQRSQSCDQTCRK